MCNVVIFSEKFLEETILFKRGTFLYISALLQSILYSIRSCSFNPTSNYQAWNEGSTKLWIQVVDFGNLYEETLHKPGNNVYLLCYIKLKLAANQALYLVPMGNTKLIKIQL